MTTYICGYWKINENVKHSYEKHYKKLIPKTLNILKDCNIIFFYDNEEILMDIKKHVQTKNIIYKKISIESLGTYELSKDYLKACKLQDNNKLKKINSINEKGLVHYSREYMRSGEKSFRKVFTVWTSKLFLLDQIMKENPFNSDYFAYIDVSASRVNVDKKYFTQHYLENNIYHFTTNLMRYYGIHLPIKGFFLIAHKNSWNKLIPLYKKQLELSKNSKYGHDEETILYLIWKEHKYLFCDITKKNITYKTNFKAAKEFVNMKIKHNNESLSGPGSFINNTKETVLLINETIKKYNIKSILDLGCGDWNWFKTIDIQGISYVGWDAHNDMIKSNNDKYGNKNIKFEVKDIILEEYDKVDLIICRDVLFHLDTSFSKICIEKIKKSCKFLISTSFNDIKENINISSYCKINNWGFYKINLNIMPFNLHKALKKSVIEKNNSSNGYNRFINLYTF